MQAFSNLTDFSADIILLNGISPSVSRVNKVKRRTIAMIIFFFAADEGGGVGERERVVILSTARLFNQPLKTFQYRRQTLHVLFSDVYVVSSGNLAFIK